MAMNPNLANTAHVHRLLKEDLLTRWPALADDDQALLDTLEGMTTLTEQVDALVQSSLEDDAQAAAMDRLVERLSERRDRFKARSDMKRKSVFEALQRAGERKMELPIATVSVRKVPPSVIILDDQQLPEQYRVHTWRPDRAAIGVALKDGTAVPGATLSNGGETLSIRTT
jgi:ElaB/YqjD/DUF883 family membrane-anchored ribosome-binding protein